LRIEHRSQRALVLEALVQLDAEVVELPKRVVLLLPTHAPTSFVEDLEVVGSIPPNPIHRRLVVARQEHEVRHRYTHRTEARVLVKADAWYVSEHDAHALPRGLRLVVTLERVQYGDKFHVSLDLKCTTAVRS
jgi:hypothetical protein